MKAFSIRQPWAWLILRPDLDDPKARQSAELQRQIKDIENRSRHWNFRGPIYIHASKGMTRAEYFEAAHFAAVATDQIIHLPPFEDLQRGGIVGRVEIADCVEISASPWFTGPFGLVLRNPVPLPFAPCRGSLGIFTPDTTPDPQASLFQS